MPNVRSRKIPSFRTKGGAPPISARVGWVAASAPPVVAISRLAAMVRVRLSLWINV